LPFDKLRANRIVDVEEEKAFCAEPVEAQIDTVAFGS
jgi:hypothetical protein